MIFNELIKMYGMKCIINVNRHYASEYLEIESLRIILLNCKELKNIFL